MKVSIITVVRNNEKTIKYAIDSVLNQTYPNIEYIIVDGASIDGTIEIIQSYGNKINKFISEKDNGIYDAMNKGIRVCSGDVIGILNSDDIYADNCVIETVVNYISRNVVDSCYGDIVYVDRKDTGKIIRYWKSGSYYKEKFKKGWMPPHPTFFCKRTIYEKYGLFNLEFPLTADYELMLRFLYKHDISTVYIPKVLVKMRAGGTSRPGLFTIRAIFEDYRAWIVNELDYPLTMLFKPFSKVPQFLKSKV